MKKGRFDKYGFSIWKWGISLEEYEKREKSKQYHVRLILWVIALALLLILML